MSIPAKEDFREVQRAFSAYLRDPENNPRPAGLPDNRLSVYRYAVYANIERFLSDNFPRIKSFYTESAWENLVRDYIVRHRSETMCFVELPKEFLEYLENIRDNAEDPPFLYELAHFEWLETLISADDRKLPEYDTPSRDLLDGVPVINPLTQLLRYSYPVHELAPDNFPDAEPEQATFIIAFRKKNNRFGFTDVNMLTARLVELLALNQEKTGREILLDLATEMGAEDLEAIVDGGADILNRLASDEVILGVS